MSLNFQDCEFMLSAVKPQHYPTHSLNEVALVGRSNVGKSSLINTIVNRRSLARTSNQPGRTQTLNFYRVDTLGIVDLPGYGFAKVSKTVKEQWKPMIEGYLLNRANLVGVLQLIDIRHPPTEDDLMMNEWLRELAIPSWAVVTKADKISRGKHKPTAEKLQKVLQVPVTIFSAETGVGKQEVAGILGNLARSERFRS